jgi:hypothetical protein
MTDSCSSGLSICPIFSTTSIIFCGDYISGTDN